MLADTLARIERKSARRARVFAGLASAPARWHRPEPRPSVQYAGHMATTAARDHRLTPQSKALLTVLRARCGNGTATATCKTTLAHIMGVCTRSIGRYVRELVRFGYIETRIRRGTTGLHVGLAVVITEKVLPCFRKAAWLAGWLAANLPADGANPGRTELSHTNHSLKEFLSPGRLQPERTP
ncbi:MAG: helix-turn-helix domain-containing protein [Hyphomicrobiaceae bacterium]